MKKEKQVVDEVVKKSKQMTQIDVGMIWDIVDINVVGKTPLLMDRMTEGAVMSILDKQTGKKQAGAKTLRDLEKEAKDAIHVTSGGKIGFPANGFLKGMMEVTRMIGGTKFSKKNIQGLKILNAEEGLVPIKYSKMDKYRHVILGSPPAIKESPRFHDWSCLLRITYDRQNISPQDIVRALNFAGSCIGVGADRPHGREGGSGGFGTYEVRLLRGE